MNIKKIIFGVISCGLLFSTFSYISPNLVEINSKADTNLQNSGKGEIVVQYVDQNGNVIRPATTVMGKTGSTYVASIPKIPGYTYSSIENGQNNSNGPQMIFGGDDPSTDIMEMSIVYKSTGNSSNNGDSNITNGNKGTVISPSKSGNSNNSSSNNTNKNSDNSNSSGTIKESNSATNNKTGSNNKNTAENNGDNSANKENDGKINNSDDKINKNTKTNDKKSNKNQNKANDDNSKNENKNQNKDKNHKNDIFWVISGIVLVVIAGVAFAWHKIRKPRHYEH